MNGSNTIEFTPVSADAPWQLATPLPTDIRAVVNTVVQPTVEQVGKALATFVGESIEAEEIEPPDRDVGWAMRVKVAGLPTDILVWVEQMNHASHPSPKLKLWSAHLLPESQGSKVVHQ